MDTWSHLVSGHLWNSLAANSSSLPTVWVPGGHLFNFFITTLYGSLQTSVSIALTKSLQAFFLLVFMVILSSFFASHSASPSWSRFPSLMPALWNNLLFLMQFFLITAISSLNQYAG